MTANQNTRLPAGDYEMLIKLWRALNADLEPDASIRQSIMAGEFDALHSHPGPMFDRFRYTWSALYVGYLAARGEVVAALAGGTPA